MRKNITTKRLLAFVVSAALVLTAVLGVVMVLLPRNGSSPLPSTPGTVTPGMPQSPGFNGSVELTSQNTWFEVGSTTQLNAKITGDSNGRTDVELEWSTNNKKVATVDQNGLVTAIGHGDVTITAKVAGSEIAANISLKAVSMTLLASRTQIPVEGTSELRVEFSGDDIPSNPKISYYSNNITVATVHGTTGVVTGVSAGAAMMTASWATAQNDIITATKTIFVQGDGTVTDIELLPNVLEVQPGMPDQFEVKFTPSTSVAGIVWGLQGQFTTNADGSVQNNVIKVDTFGEVSVREGINNNLLPSTHKVIATVAGTDISKVATVEARVVTPQSLTIDGPMQVQKGATGVYKILSSVPSNATKSVNWTIETTSKNEAKESDDKTTFTLDAIEEGDVTIVATSTLTASVVARLQVKVVDKDIATGIEFTNPNQPTIDIKVGEKASLKELVKVLPAGAVQTVRWESRGDEFVTVDSALTNDTVGTITGVKVGSADVVARAENTNFTVNFKINVISPDVSTVKSIRITSPQLANGQTKFRLLVGQELKLEATAYDDVDGKGNVVAPVVFDWWSNNKHFAEFADENVGTLKAIAPGEVTVTVQVRTLTGIQAIAYVLVIETPDVESIAITAAAQADDQNDTTFENAANALAIGTTRPLTVEVLPANEGKTYDLTWTASLSGATRADSYIEFYDGKAWVAEWKGTGNTQIRVSSAGAENETILDGKPEVQVTITAIATDNGEKVGTRTITVLPRPAATGVVVSPLDNNLTITTDEEGLRSVKWPEGATSLPLVTTLKPTGSVAKQGFSWGTNGNALTAQVSQDGVVTLPQGALAGWANITARMIGSDSVVDTLKVVVEEAKAPDTQNIVIQVQQGTNWNTVNGTLTIAYGTTRQLRLFDIDNSIVLADSQVEWTHDEKGVATVNATGLVTGTYNGSLPTNIISTVTARMIGTEIKANVAFTPTASRLQTFLETYTFVSNYAVDNLNETQRYDVFRAWISMRSVEIFEAHNIDGDAFKALKTSVEALFANSAFNGLKSYLTAAVTTNIILGLDGELSQTQLATLIASLQAEVSSNDSSAAKTLLTTLIDDLKELVFEDADLKTLLADTTNITDFTNTATEANGNLTLGNQGGVTGLNTVKPGANTIELALQANPLAANSDRLSLYLGYSASNGDHANGTFLQFRRVDNQVYFRLAQDGKHDQNGWDDVTNASWSKISANNANWFSSIRFNVDFDSQRVTVSVGSQVLTIVHVGDNKVAAATLRSFFTLGANGFDKPAEDTFTNVNAIITKMAIG